MRPGDLLYFGAEDTVLMVIMANDRGVRYFDASNPECNDDSSIVTKFATYEELDEVCSFVSSLDDIVDVISDSALRRANNLLYATMS